MIKSFVGEREKVKEYEKESFECEWNVEISLRLKF